MHRTNRRRCWIVLKNCAYEIANPKRYSKDASKDNKLTKKIAVPNINLNSGHNMPIIGLGTWESPPGVATQAVLDAIDAGYRHIDCAFIYHNECEVGKGIVKKIKEGVVKRKELFVTSKLWNTFHSPDLVCDACESSLENLGLTYLDLYLIHWPMGYKEGGDLLPRDDKGKLLHSAVDYVETWKAMEKLVKDDHCKSIGLANFNKCQIERILEVARIKPAVNQVECHPYLNQKKLMQFCRSEFIAITAYSPLGSPQRPKSFETGDAPILMEDPVLKKIAEKYKKTIAQILIRYQIQRGNIVIPKSVNKSRIIENFNVFDFQLPKEIVEEIDCLDRNVRYVNYKSQLGDHVHFPHND